MEIKITTPKIVKYVEEKDNLVQQGRQISTDLEKLEAQIKVLEDKEKAITLERTDKELEAKMKEIKDTVDPLVKEFEKLSHKLYEYKMAGIPKEMKDEHLALLKEKQDKQREINKVALKVDKIKNRVVPLIKKEAGKEMTGEYEDLETATLKDGVVVVQTFSHLENWKVSFKKRAK